MTPKNRTLEGKNWTSVGDGGSKIVKNRREKNFSPRVCNSLDDASKK